jgi:hypothetical protein
LINLNYHCIVNKSILTLKIMKENELMSFEVNAEHIPTAEEIRSIFALFTNKERVIEDRIIEKENNLFILEFTVADGPNGETAEYAYKAKRPLEKEGAKEDEFSNGTIQETYYDKDGIPFCGDTLADLINGEWIYTKEGEDAKKKMQQ